MFRGLAQDHLPQSSSLQTTCFEGRRAAETGRGFVGRVNSAPSSEYPATERVSKFGGENCMMSLEFTPGLMSSRVTSEKMAL